MAGQPSTLQRKKAKPTLLNCLSATFFMIFGLLEVSENMVFSNTCRFLQAWRREKQGEKPTDQRKNRLPKAKANQPINL